MIYDFASQASYAVTLNPKITKKHQLPISYFILAVKIEYSNFMKKKLFNYQLITYISLDGFYFDIRYLTPIFCISS